MMRKWRRPRARRVQSPAPRALQLARAPEGSKGSFRILASSDLGKQSAQGRDARREKEWVSGLAF